MSTDAPSHQSSPVQRDSPRTSRLGLALAAIVGAEFMLQLDGTIVTVALPDLQGELGIGITPASWVLNGFFVAFGGLLLLGGRLGDVFGHRRTFLSGIAILTVASLIAGLAPNIEILLIGRLLQGAGSAIAGPTGLALLTTLYEGERAQKAFGWYSTVTGLGAATGLVLGGILTQLGNWRWSLLLNVPVGVAILAIGVRTLVKRTPSGDGRSLAVPSSILVTIALTTGIYGLSRAAESGWTDTLTISALLSSAVVLALLLLVDSRATKPILPLRIFADRTRLGGFANLLLLASVLGSFLFYITQYLSNGLGFDPLHTGLALLPFGLSILITTQVLTGFVSRLSLEARALVGGVLVVLGIALLTRLDETSNYWVDVLPELIVLGLGVGLAIVPFNLVILSSTDPADTGVTAGIVQAALTVGGSIGLAVLLIPYTAQGNSADSTISGVFTWSTGIALAGVLVTLVFWFGPGSDRRAARGSRR